MPSDTRVRNVLKGAGIQLASKATSAIVWNAAQKQETPFNPAPWWYQGVQGYPLDDLVLDLGLPAALVAAGAAMKKQSLKDMALGAGVTGLATFIQVFLARTSQYPWLPFKASINKSQVSTDNPVVAATTPKPETEILMI